MRSARESLAMGTPPGQTTASTSAAALRASSGLVARDTSSRSTAAVVVPGVKSSRIVPQLFARRLVAANRRGASVLPFLSAPQLR